MKIYVFLHIEDTHELHRKLIAKIVNISICFPKSSLWTDSPTEVKFSNFFIFQNIIKLLYLVYRKIPKTHV